MFSGCRNLRELDLSSFDTNNVTNTAFMFDNCRQLKRIIVNKWSNQNNTNSDGMFLQCSELVGGNGTKYDYNHIDATYARIDKVGSPGYFTDKSQASGLQIIKKDELKQNTIFTLSGQRLVNPCKGINIINGRPYIIK
jgi:surface protein